MTPPKAADTRGAATPPAAGVPVAPAPTAAGETFLVPNTEDEDGTPAFVHFTREDMPLRVNITRPKQAARYASTAETYQTIIDAFLLWEEALKPAVPWFRLEVVEEDPDAQIQIEWKRRIAGPWGGFGGIGWRVAQGRLRAYGQLRYSIQHCPWERCILTADELRVLIAHEFGHCLGLGHCLSCDSAMNYSYATRERVVVTSTDVATFQALIEIPNGMRTDGRLLDALLRDSRSSGSR